MPVSCLPSWIQSGHPSPSTGRQSAPTSLSYLLSYALSAASHPRVLTHAERLRTSRGHTSHPPAGGVRLLPGTARLSPVGEFLTDVTDDVANKKSKAASGGR